MDKLQDRFRSEVEHEMAARWLASSLAEWIETYHGEAAELLGHKRMDWVMSAAALGAHVAKDCAGQAPSAETHAKIGELTLEKDFLSGALEPAGLLSVKR